MLEPDPYILRYEINGNDEYVTIGRFDIETYRCGLSAGDHIRLIKDIVIQDADGKPTGNIMARGDVHTVLKGSSDDPLSLQLRKPDGEFHTWNDDEKVWDDFRRV